MYEELMTYGVFLLRTVNLNLIMRQQIQTERHSVKQLSWTLQKCQCYLKKKMVGEQF